MERPTGLTNNSVFAPSLFRHLTFTLVTWWWCLHNFADSSFSLSLFLCPKNQHLPQKFFSVHYIARRPHCKDSSYSPRPWPYPFKRRSSHWNSSVFPIFSFICFLSIHCQEHIDKNTVSFHIPRRRVLPWARAHHHLSGWMSMWITAAMAGGKGSHRQLTSRTHLPFTFLYVSCCWSSSTSQRSCRTKRKKSYQHKKQKKMKLLAMLNRKTAKRND